MNWNPVIAGIDGSPESAVAATVALKLAIAADTECHLVHAARSPASAMPVPIVPRMEVLAVLNEQLVNHLRLDMKSALSKHVSPELLEGLEVEVRLGDSTWALAEAIQVDAVGDNGHIDGRRQLLERFGIGLANSDDEIGLAAHFGFVALEFLPLHQAIGRGHPTLGLLQVGQRTPFLQQILAVVVVEDPKRSAGCRR